MPSTQQHDAPARAATSAVTTADAAPRGGSPLVRLIVSGIVIATVLMVALLWHNWNGVQEPTTAVIVLGDQTLDGTIVTVTGGGRVVRAMMSPANGYNAPVLLEPGRYQVTAERDGATLLQTDVEVKRFLAVQFDLARIVREAKAIDGRFGAAPDTTLAPPQSPRQPGTGIQ
jgi:hypothetical protein